MARGLAAGAREERLMTLRELATYLNLNQRTVLKLATEGALPGVRLGAQWRFKRAVIDAWLGDQMLGVRLAAARATPAGPAPAFSFDDCLAEGHFLPDDCAAILKVNGTKYDSVVPFQCYPSIKP